MVERVEEVAIELKGDLLGDVEVFADAHVPVVEAWLTQEVTRSVAKGAEPRLREASHVQMLKLLGKVGGRIAARYAIGALRRSIQHAVNVRGVDSVWEASLERCDPGRLPS